ncbi:tail fiber protein [Sphingobacterium spiritivorum]|uniref:tail fiber protein n=1 Tax=Sphingobacterium spiritivorum TaxID=258 RepID=UPI001F211E2D|nr:tail fiber protein [Sphingobacterium spiritivorum]
MKITLSLTSFIAFMLLCHYTLAQNIVNLSDWVPGTGSTAFLEVHGDPGNSIREWGVGPYGNRVILWKGVGGINDANAGWNSKPFEIDHRKMYRFTVWLKKTNSTDGHSYFGCRNVNTLNNVPDANPYFWYGDLPELDRWYLAVGYIHGSADPSTIYYGGLYDGVTGTKVAEIQDFKFPDLATTTLHRTYLHYDTNPNDRQYFYGPRAEVVDGNEPTIEALLGINKSQADVAYFSGKVGIKTSTPREYDLAVNGKIRSQEVKVEAANWPDYVFKKDYELRSLSELQTYIEEHGHLPDMPKAAEAEKEGVSLGEMNKLLLKKVEELTLHLIKKENQLQQQNKRISEIEQQLNRINLK